MVNGYTASASEIVSGSLQDHDRGLVVGTPSFGKGLVQTLFPLEGGWAMKITTGKWYTPSGRSIQADHDRLGDERFVEYDDKEPADSAKKRPMFKSDAGRVILGGGGVTPDVTVQPDTLAAAEREFARAIGAQQSQWYVAVYGVSRDIKGTIKYDFQVKPEWREQVWNKLQETKVTVTRPQFDAAQSLVDRELENRVASLAFGDSAAFRRASRWDKQLRTALDYLKRGATQRELLALAPPITTKGN